MVDNVNCKRERIPFCHASGISGFERGRGRFHSDPGKNNEDYIATFFSHFERWHLRKNVTKKATSAVIMPVPRNLALPAEPA